ncbi:MAG TPA: class I SAM-dependent methyltransferase [Blastocatellia bacterium]|nr:class I SAM-dependent methyltransferase [Blastocatellia bacterium]
MSSKKVPPSIPHRTGLTGSINKFIEEITTTPYYRAAPTRILKFAYAKWLFSKHKFKDPVEYLKTLGIEKAAGLDRYDKWRALLERTVVTVSGGNQGGISMEDGIILYSVVRALKPRYIIETGVAAGVSTSFISAALIENGSGDLYSIELPPENWSPGALNDGAIYGWHERGPGWAIPGEIKRQLGSRHTLILQDVRTALPELLARLPWVDIFFHDDLHTPDHMLWEFELVWPHLRTAGALIADDVNYGWVRFCRDLGRDDHSFRNVQRLAAIRK